MLSRGNEFDPCGTYVMPSGPPVNCRFCVAEVRLYAPAPSSSNSTEYQRLASYDATFIDPAAGNPGGTKKTAPTELAMPSAFRSVTFTGLSVPGRVCASMFDG